MSRYQRAGYVFALEFDRSIGLCTNRELGVLGTVEDGCTHCHSTDDTVKQWYPVLLCQLL